MPSRTSAQSSLAAKHIDGIKKWSTISKNKFFAKEFNNGKSIYEIQRITGSAYSTIKKGIQDYNLIDYALSLPEWCEKESSLIVDLNKLKVSPFTRIFNASAKTPEIPSLSKILEMSYSASFQPISSLPKNVFDHCIYLIAKSSFDKNIKFDTRSTLEDIVGLVDYMKSQNAFTAYFNTSLPAAVEAPAISVSAAVETPAISAPAAVETPAISAPAAVETPAISAPAVSIPTPENALSLKNISAARTVLIPSTLDISSTSPKINNIILELKKLNLNIYPNAAATLFRVLIELSAKYFLTKNQQLNKISENQLLTTVNNALTFMSDNKMLNNKIYTNIRRLGNNGHVFDIFNGYMHYDGVLPIKQDLINLFDNYTPFIIACLK